MALLAGGHYGKSSAAELILYAGDGGTILQADVGAPYSSIVAIRFLTAGFLQTGLSKDGAAISWTNWGNWIDPTTAATGDYDVRYTNYVSGASSGDFTVKPAVEDAWIAMSSDRAWQMFDSGAGTTDFTCDFEVRDGGGAPPATDTVAYTFRTVNI